MTDLYNVEAPKKPTNVSINSDLLSQTRSLKINLSATLEQALAEQLRALRRAQWRQENASAIQAYNSREQFPYLLDIQSNLLGLEFCDLTHYRSEIIAAVDFVLSGI